VLPRPHHLSRRQRARHRQHPVPLAVPDHGGVERGRDDKLRSRVHGPAAGGEVQNGPGADQEVIPGPGGKLANKVQGPRHRQSDLDRADAAAAQGAARVQDTVRRRNPDDRDDPRCLQPSQRRLHAPATGPDPGSRGSPQARLTPLTGAGLTAGITTSASSCTVSSSRPSITHKKNCTPASDRA
jgi:hypothetical protein